MPYRGTRPPSHASNLSRACAVAVGLVVSGCSFSYQLDNLFAKKDEPQYTGSLRLAQNRPTGQMPPEADLLMARAAVNEMLARGGKDTSMSWENPDTGARGTITPLASAYTQDGSTCRDFLASYVRQGTESWLQGAACRPARGQWEVRHLRRWKNT